MKRPTALALMAALAASGGTIDLVNPGNSTPKDFDELAGVDIDKEYELIQSKKSTLSARLRRVVEHRYHMKSTQS